MSLVILKLADHGGWLRPRAIQGWESSMKMSMGLIPKALTAVLSAFALVMLAVAPASAERTALPAEDTSGVWWHNLDTGEVQRFDTQKEFELAVEAQTGAALSYGTHGARSEVSPLAAYVLVTLYDAPYKSGILGSYNVTTSISTMCASHSFTLNSMAWGWNDVVSSFQSYGTCRTRLSEHTNQGGAQLGPLVSADTLGAMDNRTSSLWITG